MLTPASKGGGDQGRRVLVAVSGEKGRAQWERLLREAGFQEVGLAASGGEARRMLLSGGWDTLVIHTPLPDEFGRQLAMDASQEGPGVLLVVKSELWEEASAQVSSFGVLTLGRPFSRGALAQALGLWRLLRRGCGNVSRKMPGCGKSWRSCGSSPGPSAFWWSTSISVKSRPTNTWSARPWRSGRPAGPWRRRSCGSMAEAALPGESFPTGSKVCGKRDSKTHPKGKSPLQEGFFPGRTRTG